MGRWYLVIGLALVGLTFDVRPVVAQSEYMPHGFLSTRYDTHTSSNMYFGYTIGPLTPMVALVANPRTTYREHLVGVVWYETFTPRLGLTWAVAGSKTIDSWYGQLYALPSVSFGKLKYDATFELYVPLEAQGVRQFGMNPGNLMYDATPRLAVGAVGVWATQSNAPHNFGGGPSVKLRIPKGSITFDGVMGVTRWDSEWRISFFTAY